MAPGKMRLSELVLLYYAFYDILPEDMHHELLDKRVNFGSVFAHHLVSLKTKPFTGTGQKTETVGSLLTPIFEYLGIDLSSCSLITTRPTMDEAYLKNAKWLKAGWIWCYTTRRVSYTIRLPARALTAVDSIDSLRFEPTDDQARPRPPTRACRGTSSQVPPSAAEDDLIDAEPTSPPALPETPPSDMDSPTFRRYMVQSVHSIWSALATLSRCGCVSSSRRRRRSPTPVLSSSDDDEES